MKNLLKYLGFLVFLFILWYLGFGYFSFLLFLMTLCLICICLLLSLLPMKKTTVSLKLLQEYCIRDEKINLIFYRQSNTPIDCGQIIIECLLLDVFSKTVMEKKICLQDYQSEYSFDCLHCGHYTVQIKQIECFDILQCFSYSKAVSIQTSFDVLPHYHSIIPAIDQIYQLDDQGHNYLTNQKGDDYSNIFEIRKYHEGDELKHIHWNMSSKFQELLVKVGSQPIQEKLILAMVYQDNNQFYDLQFDYFYSLCLSLLKENIVFEIVMMANHQDIKLQTIDSFESLMTTIRWLMKNPIKSLNEVTMPKSFCLIKGQNLEVHHS